MLAEDGKCLSPKQMTFSKSTFFKCFPFVREILFILIYRETLVFISLTEHSDSVLDDFVEESSQSSGSTRSYIFY